MKPRFILQQEIRGSARPLLIAKFQHCSSKLQFLRMLK
jgi:hypothetical protein